MQVNPIESFTVLLIGQKEELHCNSVHDVFERVKEMHNQYDLDLILSTVDKALSKRIPVLCSNVERVLPILEEHPNASIEFIPVTETITDDLFRQAMEYCSTDLFNGFININIFFNRSTPVEVVAFDSVVQE
jgi:hypothetical protein